MRQFHFFLLITLTTCTALVSELALAANPQVIFETNRGDFIVELYPEKAPKTVANFMKYVDAGFYKETIFHRVINRFMIQGGGFSADMSEKETLAPIINEAANGLLNEPGTIAMARTSDPNSATAQFFINLENNVPLNFQGSDPDLIGYCVFGRVLKGMDVVREIGASPTKNVGPYADVPKSTVLIHQIRLNNKPL
ncbi:MAG: peptidylprolyl isomerase [Sulfuritalea sp.]|jgi:peptidyl-prolyl cis-trans isomerase A (cyclophilin A)|nr:peptidylprolyl isomerase [Sulfuritalea sp.]